MGGLAKTLLPSVVRSEVYPTLTDEERDDFDEVELFDTVYFRRLGP